MARVKKERLKKGNIFVPLIFSFGAILEDLSMEVFLQDPTKVSNALRTIHQYFGTDGIFAYGDDQLLRTSLGCLCGCTGNETVSPDRLCAVENRLEEMLGQGRLPIALDVTKRLQMLLPETLLTGLLTGPVTLAAQLTGFSAAEVLAHPKLISVSTKATLMFARALGDMGIDILIVSEDALPPLDGDLSRLLTRAYSPIWNTAKYYGTPALLMVRQFSRENVAALGRIVDGLILPSDTEQEVWQRSKKISLSIPVSLMEESPEAIAAYLSRSGIAAAMGASSLFLVTTEGEISPDMDKESMIRGVQIIRDHLRRAPFIP
jgi:uroporphyrinogen-III decarboxylase